MGRSDLCKHRAVVTAWGQGWLQKGLVLLTQSALGLTHSRAGSQENWGAQGGCVTSALGTTLLPWGKQGHSSFRGACTQGHPSPGPVCTVSTKMNVETHPQTDLYRTEHKHTQPHRHTAPRKQAHLRWSHSGIETNVHSKIHIYTCI